jgi:Kef-type K+ transport system membrane component KefB
MAGVEIGPVLVALATVTASARACGWAFERLLGQPAVIGETVAGIALGPSLLGWVAPGLAAWVVPAAAGPGLGLVAQLGVVLFMFVVGLELDTRRLSQNPTGTLLISWASIAAPFVLGLGFATWLYPRYAEAGGSFPAFALFIGVSMSVTAFPVLARILKDRQLQLVPLGVTALAAASIGDVTAWALLAVVVAVARADAAGLWTTALGIVAYLAVMFGIVRPLLARLTTEVERRDAPLPRTALATVFVGLIASAAATDAIGIHPLFGAFLFGALIPLDSRLGQQLRARVEDIVLVLFLPAFFAYTGLQTKIGLVSGAQDWAVCVAIVALATVGKVGGGFVAARVSGHDTREAAAIGVLLNTRGLMELVVLGVGLQLGVIGPKLYAMFVVMALATTLATSPILAMILGRSVVAPDGLGQPRSK